MQDYDAIEMIRAKYSTLQHQLDERTRRLWAAAEANALGHGGTRTVSKATGMSETTIRLGRRELVACQLSPPPAAQRRVRHPGGGRKRLTAKDERLLQALDALVDPTSRGDPVSPLRWTCKSTRQLEAALQSQGFQISHTKIGQCLKKLGYSLQSTRKRYEGKSHPDRDAQFGVGTTHDTAQFAVATLRQWWLRMGCVTYPHAKELLITADSGGSNGARCRLWKTELQKVADEMGRKITVCHFPPGTSKWNKIEHRMFCHITGNWRGRPLTSYGVIVNLIANTTTSTGLTIEAEIDTRDYPTGIKITDEQISELNLTKHDFHGSDWNYTLEPRTDL